MSCNEQRTSTVPNPAKIKKLIIRLQELLRCSICRCLPDASDKLLLLRDQEIQHAASLQRCDEVILGLSPTVFVCLSCWENLCPQDKVDPGDGQDFQEHLPPITISQAMTISADRFIERKVDNELVDPFRLLKTIRRLYQLLAESDGINNAHFRVENSLPNLSLTEPNDEDDKEKRTCYTTRMASTSNKTISAQIGDLDSCTVPNTHDVPDPKASKPALLAIVAPSREDIIETNIDPSSLCCDATTKQTSKNDNVNKNRSSKEDANPSSGRRDEECSREKELETLSELGNAGGVVTAGESLPYLTSNVDKKCKENYGSQNNTESTCESYLLPQTADFLSEQLGDGSHPESIASHMLPQTEDFMNNSIPMRSSISRNGERRIADRFQNYPEKGGVSKVATKVQPTNSQENTLRLSTTLTEPTGMPMQNSCLDLHSSDQLHPSESQRLPAQLPADLGSESPCESVATAMLPETADFMDSRSQKADLAACISNGTSPSICESPIHSESIDVQRYERAPSSGVMTDSKLNRKRFAESSSKIKSLRTPVYSGETVERPSKQTRIAGRYLQGQPFDESMHGSAVESVLTDALPETADIRELTKTPLGGTYAGDSNFSKNRLPWTHHVAFSATETLSVLTETFQFSDDRGHVDDDACVSLPGLERDSTEETGSGFGRTSVEGTVKKKLFPSTVGDAAPLNLMTGKPDLKRAECSEHAACCEAKQMSSLPAEHKIVGTRNDDDGVDQMKKANTSSAFSVPAVAVVTPLQSSGMELQSCCNNHSVQGSQLSRVHKNGIPLILEDDALLEFDKRCLRSLQSMGICSSPVAKNYDKMFGELSESFKSNAFSVTCGEFQKNPFLNSACQYKNEVSRWALISLPQNYRSAKGSLGPLHQQSRILVCLRTFSFLRARAHGLSILSSACLHEAKELGHWEYQSFRVWGDATLYGKVLEGRTPWFRDTDWWDKPNFSPCQSSIRASQEGKKLFDNLKFVVPESDPSLGRSSSNTWTTEPILENYLPEQFLDTFPYNEDAGHLSDSDVSGTKCKKLA